MLNDQNDAKTMRSVREKIYALSSIIGITFGSVGIILSSMENSHGLRRSHSKARPTGTYTKQLSRCR